MLFLKTVVGLQPAAKVLRVFPTLPQKILKMCTQGLRWNKTNMFYCFTMNFLVCFFKPWGCGVKNTMTTSVIWCYCLGLVLRHQQFPFIAFVSVHIPTQWKRQMTFWYYYGHSFDLTTPLKVSWGCPGVCRSHCENHHCSGSYLAFRVSVSLFIK